MSDASLDVWREVGGEFQRVGAISGGRFAYSTVYLESDNAAAISLNLPLGEEPFDARRTSAFFRGLLPEGETWSDFVGMLRSEGGGYTKVLEGLRNETVGALVFGERPSWDEASYEPLGGDVLRRLAKIPQRAVVELGMRTRKSLAGAQPKVGLYHAGSDVDRGWHVPLGIAPSTHIVKNPNKLFPGDSVYEALCCEVTRLLDLPVAETELIRIDGNEPLLAVKRFDRVFEGSGRTLDGLRVPLRLHQEDMCQASGFSGEFKYEPTGACYANRCSVLAARGMRGVYNTTMVLFYMLCLDFVLGNCDNHLKNRSLLWNEGWTGFALAPFYDITNTTLYPGLDREMGISFGGSRKIDDVTPLMIMETGESCGIPRDVAWALFEEIAEESGPAIERAGQNLADKGFPDAVKAARRLLADADGRRSLAGKR